MYLQIFGPLKTSSSNNLHKSHWLLCFFFLIAFIYYSSIHSFIHFSFQLFFYHSPRFEVQIVEERKPFAHIVCHACGEQGHKSTHCAVARRLNAEAAMRVCQCFTYLHRA